MFVLERLGKHIQALVFSPDAATLYATNLHTDAVAWNLTDRSARQMFIGGKRLIALSALHPGGQWAFGRIHTTRAPLYVPHLFHLSEGTVAPLNFIDYPVGIVAMAPDGSHLVTIGHSVYDHRDRPAETACYRLYGWTMTVGGPEYEWHQDVPRNVFTFGVTALGSARFATAEAVAPVGLVASSSAVRPAQVAIRRASDGAALAALDFPHPGIQQLLAAPDGTKLVVRCGTELRAWDSTNWAKPPAVIEGKYKRDMKPPAAAFHPSGNYLLLANDGPSVIVYDTRTWKEVRRWNWKAGALRAVAVSPDSTLAAAGGPRGTVVVWDLDL